MKRSKPDEIVDVLEFEGRTEKDVEFEAWLAEHRAAKGGKIRISLGGRGVRVMFSKEADMVIWKRRAEIATQLRNRNAA